MTPRQSAERIAFPESAQAGLIDSLPIAIVVTDTALRLVFVNRRTETLLGCERREILGDHVTVLIPLATVSHHDELFPLRSTPQGPEDRIDGTRECVLTSREGHSFPAEIRSFPVMNGTSRYFAVLIRDLTEDHVHEREQLRIRRLADLGKAISIIAHEIRKRLTLIGGFAHQLCVSRLTPENTAASAKLKIIMDEVSALERMLNGIRLFGRLPDSSSHHPMDLNGLVQETLQLLQPACEKRSIRISTDLSVGPLEVRGDSDLLKQVLLNVVQNALDSLTGKGWVQVRTERRKGSAAAIYVDDSGAGIPRDLEERIFDPFFTTKVGGTGLGLAISRHIIEDHGGRISFRPGIPKGTTFVIELPLQADTPDDQ